MYCPVIPVIKVANEVVTWIRQLETKDRERTIVALSRLHNDPFPEAGEQYMGTPPDRFVRSLGVRDWVVGYDLCHEQGKCKLIALNAKEVWIWHVGPLTQLLKESQLRKSG